MKPKILDVHFRDGFRLPEAVDVDAARQCLLELHREHRHLSAPQVLERAKPTSSPIHGFFQWDNEAAAQQYRLWQARHLLGSVMLKVEMPDGQEINVRQFLHVNLDMNPSGETEPRYLELNMVLSDAELRQQQIDLAMAELGRWAARWAVLQEFKPCFAAIRRWRDKFAVQSEAA